MSKIVQISSDIETPKIGLKKARGRKRINLEDYGQLNMFSSHAKVVSINEYKSFFDQAVTEDEEERDSAIRFYNRAIELDDRPADAYCNLGVLHSSSDVSEAINNLTKCLEIEARHAEAHYNLGNIYFDLGELKLALVHYKMAINSAPDFVSAYYNQGLLYIKLDELTKARESLLNYKKLNEDKVNDEFNHLLNELDQRIQPKFFKL